MNLQDYKEEKLNLITWISQLEDATVIEKLKHIREDTITIPQWQKDIVLERIRNSEGIPERLLNWEEVKDDFIID